MVFIFSIMMAFSETEGSSLFFNIQIISCVLYIIDIILNFISQRFENGKKLYKIGEISHYYLKNGLIIDLISIILFPVSVLTQIPGLNFVIPFIYLVKLLNSIRKLEKFEYLLITSS